MKLEMCNSRRRSVPISRALSTRASARHTSGYASACREHQNIEILAHIIRQNRTSQVESRS